MRNRIQIFFIVIDSGIINSESKMAIQRNGSRFWGCVNLVKFFQKNYFTP